MNENINSSNKTETKIYRSRTDFDEKEMCNIPASLNGLIDMINSTNPMNLQMAQCTLKTITEFCKVHPITDLHDIENVSSLFISLFPNPNLNISIFGLACFTNAFCQPKQRYPLEFLPKLTEEILKLLDLKNIPYTRTAIYVIAKLSGMSVRHSSIIAQFFNLEILSSLIQCGDLKIIHKTLFIIGNICMGIEVSSEFADFICQMVDIIIQSQNIVLCGEAIWCCENMTRRYFKWSIPVIKYNLLEKFNEILINTKSIVLKSRILSFIRMSFKNSVGFSIFNIPYLIGLMKFGICAIQAQAIICLVEYIRKNQHSIQQLIESGLTDSIVYCLNNGSFKGKVKVCQLIDEILSFNNQQITNYFLQIHICYYIADIMSIVNAKSALTCLHIISILLLQADAQQIANEIENSDILYNLADSDDPLISEKAEVIIQELGW